MAKRTLIREDANGIFFQAGGWKFRPKANKSHPLIDETGHGLKKGDYVTNARHIGGTSIGKCKTAAGQTVTWVTNSESPFLIIPTANNRDTDV